MRILAISGSLREGSSNLLLLRAARHHAPTGVEVALAEPLDRLPYFNPDLDTDDAPAEIRRFRDKLAEADALLFSTPEYAHGIPGVLKNALDWLVSDPRLAGKRVGLIFASASEGSFAQQALVEVLRTMSMELVEGATINFSGPRSLFDGEGKLVSLKAAAALSDVLQALAGPTSPSPLAGPGSSFASSG